MGEPIVTFLVGIVIIANGISLLIIANLITRFRREQLQQALVLDYISILVTGLALGRNPDEIRSGLSVEEQDARRSVRLVSHAAPREPFWRRARGED
jgi:hypothetical protein